MRCLFHRFGPWQDVKLGDEARAVAPLVMVVRETIAQQRRCDRCNLVKTRRS